MLTLFFRRCVETSRLELGTGWNNFTPWAAFFTCSRKYNFSGSTLDKLPCWDEGIWSSKIHISCSVPEIWFWQIHGVDASHFSFIPASKMTLIGPVGDTSYKLKTRSHICQWLAQTGGTTCLLLPGFYSNSFHQASVLRLIQRHPNISKMEIIYVLWH